MPIHLGSNQVQYPSLYIYLGIDQCQNPQPVILFSSYIMCSDATTNSNQTLIYATAMIVHVDPCFVNAVMEIISACPENFRVRI